MKLNLALAVMALSTCAPEPVFAEKHAAVPVYLKDAATKLNPNKVGAQKAVLQAVTIAISMDCRDSRMVRDHYWPATWALGSCELDAVTLLVLAWEEGHFCYLTGCPRGDSGHSVGTFQVSGWIDGKWNAELTDLYERDLVAAARAAYSVLREGARVCPDEPLAPYCGGCHPDYSRPHATDSRAMAHARRAQAEDLLTCVVDVDAP